MLFYYSPWLSKVFTHDSTLLPSIKWHKMEHPCIKQTHPAALSIRKEVQASNMAAPSEAFSNK